MQYKSLISQLLVISLCFIIVACGGGSSSTDETKTPIIAPASYIYQQPVSTDWQTAHLSDQSIAVEPFEQLVRKIQDSDSGYRYIDSVTVIYQGKLVFDVSFRDSLDLGDSWAGNTDVSLHVLNSVTKSVTSALIGIAIERGDIPSVNVGVHDYFQHKQPIDNWTAAKGRITLRHWLTMQHGYQWDEWNISYLNNQNLNSQMNNADDPIQFLLDRPIVAEPGTTFAYSTGVSFGLGRLLEHATGTSVTDYMETHLFTPLGIENYTYWQLDGQLHTGSSLYLTPRDMAKFGQLFLNKGHWQGQQIVSESWVEESTTPYHLGNDWGYGYQWWSTTFTVANQDIDTFYGDGFGGQYIFVLPSLDAVVVFTGRAYQNGQLEEYKVRNIMQEDILPALANQ